MSQQSQRKRKKKIKLHIAPVWPMQTMLKKSYLGLIHAKKNKKIMILVSLLDACKLKKKSFYFCFFSPLNFF